MATMMTFSGDKTPGSMPDEMAYSLCMVRRSDAINSSLSFQGLTCGCPWSTEKALSESLQVRNLTARGSRSRSFLVRFLYVCIALLKCEWKEVIGRAGGSSDSLVLGLVVVCREVCGYHVLGNSMGPQGLM